MTEVTGRSFLSYRRSRSGEARLLIEAQHEIGIPTWRDVQDLEEEHTEEAIRTVLNDTNTANAILWLTPDVADSKVINRVEVPLIVARNKRRDGFFVVPVAAGGTDYATAAEAAGQELTTEDLKRWNLRKVRGNPIKADEAAVVAARVLKRRLNAIHQAMPADMPLSLTIDTRIAPAAGGGGALTLDWTHHFTGRTASENAWQLRLLPALRTVVDNVQQQAPGRRIEARGRPSISAAVALGSAVLAPLQLPIGWWQFTLGRPDQMWSLDADREASGLVGSTEGAEPDGDDLAVLVSVADDIKPAFGATQRSLPPLRAITQIEANDGGSVTLTNPEQAVDAAYVVIEAIRKARQQYRPSGTIHLFMAVPVGLAMMIGQLLNTLGAVQLYEHEPDGAVGRYLPSVLLRPSA